MKRKCLGSRRKTENERPRVHKQSSGGRIQGQMFAREMSTFKMKHLKQLRWRKEAEGAESRIKFLDTYWEHEPYKTLNLEMT